MTGWLAGSLARRTPTTLLVLAGLVIGLARLLVELWRRPWLLYVLATVAGCWWLVRRYDPATVAGAALGLAMVVAFVVAYWREVDPGSFDRRLGGPVRSWRRGRYYRARWDDAMLGCGLVRSGVVPTVMSVRSTGGVDRLTVHMAPGQLAADWRDLAPRLAGALGVRSVRTRADGPRDVLLLVRWREIRHRDPEVGSDALVDLEVAETTEQIRQQLEAEPIRPATGGAFPRRPR